MPSAHKTTEKRSTGNLRQHWPRRHPESHSQLSYHSQHLTPQFCSIQVKGLIHHERRLHRMLLREAKEWETTFYSSLDGTEYVHSDKNNGIDAAPEVHIHRSSLQFLRREDIHR